MATWDLRRLQQALDKKKTQSLYFIFGDEPYLVNEALTTLRQTALSDGAIDFNYDQFFATETKSAQVRDTVEMLPMMCPKRVVIYRDVDKLKEKDWEVLQPLFDSPVDTCTFILVAEKVDKRKKYFKKISEKGILVELKRPYENQVPAWIEYISYKNGVELDKNSISLIQQLVGGHLDEVNNELKKLSQFLGDKKKATHEDILKVVSRSRIDSIFDLTDAIGRKDKGNALVYLANLLENGQSEIGVMALILRHVRILAALSEGKKNGLRGGQLSQKAGVPSYFLQKYMDQCRVWDDKKISKTIHALHKTDLALKSSPVSSHIWLENFILQTC